MALDVTLVDQVGDRLGAFLRWLVEGTHSWTLDELLDVVDDPHAFEPEWAEFLREEMRASAPTADECEGEERASR